MKKNFFNFLKIKSNVLIDWEKKSVSEIYLYVNLKCIATRMIDIDL